MKRKRHNKNRNRNRNKNRKRRVKKLQREQTDYLQSITQYKNKYKYQTKSIEGEITSFHTFKQAYEYYELLNDRNINCCRISNISFSHLPFEEIELNEHNKSHIWHKCTKKELLNPLLHVDINPSIEELNNKYNSKLCNLNTELAKLPDDDSDTIFWVDQPRDLFRYILSYEFNQYNCIVTDRQFVNRYCGY